jgi:hypothetical protein
MSEWLTYLELGFRHIVALDAADHILFLLVLSAIYRIQDWRAALWVITAFTVGHSITLLLAATNTLVLPTAIVEFLIPVTIVLTGIENLILRDRAAQSSAGKHRPVFAGVFGLVHGAGFAEYLRSLFVDEVVVPLFGFNVGIELGQLVVLTVAIAVYWMIDRAVKALDRSWTIVHEGTGRPGTLRPFEVRMVGVSLLVTVVAAGWALERWPR